MKNRRLVIPSNYDALVQTLVLAITAPTEAHLKRAIELADCFASQLTAEDIARAKEAAKAIVASNS